MGERERESYRLLVTYVYPGGGKWNDSNRLSFPNVMRSNNDCFLLSFLPVRTSADHLFSSSPSLSVPSPLIGQTNTRLTYDEGIEVIRNSY